MQKATTIQQQAVLHLCFNADPQNVRGARNSVADFTRQQAFPSEDVDAVVLAVGEACSNAVSYGGRGYSDPKVDVSCCLISSNQIQIDVQNQGNSFHPNLEEAAALPDDFSLHGRGFALMCALVDDVQVLSDGGNTIVRLIKTKSA